MAKIVYSKKDKLIKEKRHNAYPSRGKISGPAACTECGARYLKGRWTWEKSEGEKPSEIICPACRRIAENYPAGFIDIQGAFFQEHQEEIRNRVLNIEKLEKERYPLERIMRTESKNGGILVTTTGVHIARRIGEALASAFQGELEIQYAEGAKRIRVNWKR